MRFLWFIALSLSMVLSGGDALGRSRSSRRASGSDRRHSSSHARSTHERGRRGERISSRGRRGRGERYARGRHGRHERYARGGRSYEPRETGTASYSRPGASGIPTERVTEIQNALIKGGYLTGPASGQYDDATSSAMRRFQSANGVQSTGLPSAAALKKLGVSKGSNDGYAVSIKSATQRETSPSAPPDAAKPKP